MALRVLTATFVGALVAVISLTIYNRAAAHSDRCVEAARLFDESVRAEGPASLTSDEQWTVRQCLHEGR